jgi:hypothetical protein
MWERIGEALKNVCEVLKPLAPIGKIIKRQGKYCEALNTL